MKRQTPVVANTAKKRQKVAPFPPPTENGPHQASLLGIPVELRLQILELLLPDIDHKPNCDHKAIPHSVETEHDHEHCTSCTHNIPLRHDGSKCWPKVLRVNRQVYDEVKNQMHKDKSVEIRINPNEVTMCSRKYCTQHFEGQGWGARYFQTELAHFTDVKLTVSLTLQDIVSNAPARRLRTNRKFAQMKLVVSHLADALAERNGLTDLDVAVNVHFEERLYSDIEEALGMDIAELLQDIHMKELIGRSACWLLGPFNQIHNLRKAKYEVGITGLKNPPRILWNMGLVKFLEVVTTQSMVRRSSRAGRNSSARPEVQELNFSDLMELR